MAIRRKVWPILSDKALLKAARFRLPILPQTQADGIAPPELGKLFPKFWQISSDLTHSFT